MYIYKKSKNGVGLYARCGNFNTVKSVRFDDESIAVIESMPGKNFSRKLRYLISEYLELKNLPG